jgi:hypothetical protein
MLKCWSDAKLRCRDALFLSAPDEVDDNGRDRDRRRQPSYQGIKEAQDDDSTRSTPRPAAQRQAKESAGQTG